MSREHTGDANAPTRHLLFEEGYGARAFCVLYDEGAYHLLCDTGERDTLAFTTSEDAVTWCALTSVRVADGSFAQGTLLVGALLRANDGYTLYYTREGDGEGTPSSVYEARASSCDGAWDAGETPIISSVPEGFFSDSLSAPFVTEREGRRMLIVSATRSDGGGPAFLLYTSVNEDDWLYQGVFYAPTHLTANATIASPCLSVIDGNDVLFYTLHEKGTRVTRYAIGTVTGNVFHVRTSFPIDGGDFVVPFVSLGKEGSMLLFGLLQEASDDVSAHPHSALTFPRSLSVSDEGYLLFFMVEATKAVRGQYVAYPATRVPTLGNVLTSVSGTSLEVRVQFSAITARRVGLTVRSSIDAKEQTSVGYDRARQELYVARTHSSRNPLAASNTKCFPLLLREGDPLDLHVLLDVSILEVFANKRAAIGTRIFPTQSDSLGVALFAHEGEANVSVLEVWERGEDV